MGKVYFHWDGDKLAELVGALKTSKEPRCFGGSFIDSCVILTPKDNLVHDDTSYKLEWEKKTHYNLDNEQKSPYTFKLQVRLGKREFTPLDQTEFFEYTNSLYDLLMTSKSPEVLPESIELNNPHCTTGKFFPMNRLFEKGFRIRKINLGIGFSSGKNWFAGKEGDDYLSLYAALTRDSPMSSIAHDLKAFGFRSIRGRLEEQLNQENL